MISVAGRSANLASALKSTSQAVANGAKSVVSAGFVNENNVISSTSGRGSGILQNAGKLTGSSGIGVGSQIRCMAVDCHKVFKEVRDAPGGGHYDIPEVNFDEVRHSTGLDPTVTDTESQEARKVFSYVAIGTGLSATAYLTKNLLRGVVAYLAPAKDCLALGSIEVELNNIPEGKSVVFKWRGKPLFIKHRTSSEIEKERKEEWETFRDPQSDEDRVTDPKWLVLIGICTHLGCVPIADAGDYGGYYCPCHGSHYDGSGRIRRGPAPLNLEIPPYKINPGEILVVG